MKWLQWLVDNAWTVVIIGGVLAQMLQAIMRKKGGEEASPGEPPEKEYEFEDPELAERTRRIREEIQRKISRRQQGEAPEPAPAAEYAEEPPPLIRDVVVARSEPPPVRSTARIDSQRQAEILEQQAMWETRLSEAKRMKDAAARRTEFEQATADQRAVNRQAARSAVLDDLRSPEALRRAFILREVLGPPVALRK